MNLNSEKVVPPSELIEEFKDLIRCGLLDCASRTVTNNNLLRLSKINSKIYKMNNDLNEFEKEVREMKLSFSDSNQLADLLKEANSSIKNISKEFQMACLDRRNKDSKGKNRIHFSICCELLKVIYISEYNNLDLNWLKNYLMPNGEAENDWYNCVYKPKSSLNIPTPSSSDKGINWIYKVKETLERSYFSPFEGPVLKDTNNTEYLKTKNQFYEIMKECISHNF